MTHKLFSSLMIVLIITACAPATPAPAPTTTPVPATSTATIIPTPTLGIGSTLTSDKDGMTLVFVPAGEFTMGSDTGYKTRVDLAGLRGDERPEHQVVLDAFWIDQTEVTNAMYAKCVADGTCNSPGLTKSYTRDSYYDNPEFDHYPVIYVWWNMAKTYCEWAGRRLPTEAEWEKAARGTDARTYPWGDESPNANLLNYNSNAGDTTEVGNYPNGKSIYGALDMAGNVGEWVNDWYDVYPGGDTNISSDFGQTYRVVRGGAWYFDYDSVRSTPRLGSEPATGSSSVGFRCARSPSATSAPPTSTPLPPTATPFPLPTISFLTTTPSAVPTLGPTSTPPTATRGIVQTLTGNDGMTLLYVPAGEFTMGSDNGRSDEKPVQTVYLDAFWIDQTEVTNAMYAKCVADGACQEPTHKISYTHSSYYDNPEFDHYPMILVNWNMAKTYCEWVDRRLPTEAEWEKAARGENAFVYPWGNDAPNNNLLNYNSAVGDTTEVGNYQDGASPYGALDMAGNVWEWVADWYDVYPGGDPNSSSDFGQNYRVLRGGSWFRFDGSVRSASRYWSAPSSVSYNIGFRCSRSP